MKTVANILNKKVSHYNMVETGTNVMNALSLMNASPEGFIIVTRDGRYAGIVTERDYAQKVILAGKSSYQTKVEEIMNCNLPAVSSTDSIERCMMLMNAYCTRYLPVFDDFEFKNVITMNDLLEEIYHFATSFKLSKRGVNLLGNVKVLFAKSLSSR